MPEQQSCKICGKSLVSGSLTQWLFGKGQCTCAFSPGDEESSLAKLMCWTCGKPVVREVTGTFTQWVFRSDYCRCQAPKLSQSGSTLRTADAGKESSVPPQLHEMPDTESGINEPVIETFADRYDILALIGTGGNGSVYKAKDSRLLNYVAIKRLDRRNLTPRQVAKLQSEARAASRLHHKNLVNVIDFGIAGDEPYLVMEYARGSTLNQVLTANGTLPVDTAIGIALQICEGLAHAHHNGVIHCDLNSHNIMIDGKTVDSCQVKILDFGVARIYDSADSSILSLTQSGAFAGNPFYVSPEQCRGGKLDPRTDIYSLGCLLFEMLTGKPPYVGDNVAETIMMHINAPVPLLISKDGDAEFSSKLKN